MVLQQARSMGVAAEVVELFRIVAEGPKHGGFVVETPGVLGDLLDEQQFPGIGEQDNKARIE